MSKLRLFQTCLGLIAIASSATVLSLSAARPALAQRTNVDPLEDFQTQDGSTNPFEATDSNGQQGIYELIHRVMLSNGTSMDEFTRQRQENITTEAETFRNQQLQRIQIGNSQELDPSSDDAVDGAVDGEITP